MKLNRFIKMLCDSFNNEVGCDKCPHANNCWKTLIEEIDKKTNFELDTYE